MKPESRPDAVDLAERWRDLAAGKIIPGWHWHELDDRGEVIMKPRPSGPFRALTSAVATQLVNKLGTRVCCEVPVITNTFGVRVPTIVWAPPERWQGIELNEPLPFVPDLCVEVLDPKHVGHRTDLKIAAYLEGGAREVMVVEMSSGITYWDVRGERQFPALGVELSLGQLSPCGVGGCL
ncbi:hypothetical protein AYM40_09860 [Paraburkholderia phytofirmans OLGA172]|uniref:Putative restriction endonuclease domain-containing protein n=1 Tax=Paraburkholderia phytofirmans OLGA172 TaxID=1417228 RepID=A0A160FJT8_9BURK|nr:Uma2 family endonuclease [Paraburkholderia phytofirmans]ANB72639.1 hypothetical protein AYM40_09860 [Paraburkholderia phytofirmans OLGA172]